MTAVNDSEGLFDAARRATEMEQVLNALCRWSQTPGALRLAE